ncbi:hypothetical protein HZB88_01275 [archaeon]|nr:hypothetical protein [archaeon]
MYLIKAIKKAFNYIFEGLTQKEKKSLQNKNKILLKRITLLEEELFRAHNAFEGMQESYKTLEGKYGLAREECIHLKREVSKLEKVIAEGEQLIGIYKKDAESANAKYNEIKYVLENYGRHVQEFMGLPKNMQGAMLNLIPLKSKKAPKDKIKLNRQHEGSRNKSPSYMALLRKISEIPYIDKVEDVEAVYADRHSLKLNDEFIDCIFRDKEKREHGGFKFRVYFVKENDKPTHQKELVAEMVRIVLYSYK